MQKISTMQTSEENILNGQLTIGLDLGDRFSSYCILDEVGKILREQKVPTTPEEMQQTFGRMVRSRIAMETGTHSPWVSRLLTGLGHAAISSGNHEWIEHGIARSLGAAGARGGIVKRAHQGIRSTDRKNGQGDLPRSRAAQTSEGRRRPDRPGLCADHRGPASLPEESRRWMFCGVAAWAEGLWRERATDAHQQRGRRVFTEAAGAGGALHFGTLWGR